EAERRRRRDEGRVAALAVRWTGRSGRGAGDSSGARDMRVGRSRGWEVGRFGALLLAACGTHANAPTQSTQAPLSLAADAAMVQVPAGKYVAGSTPEERSQAYDDYLASAGKDAARDGKWFDSEED